MTAGVAIQKTGTTQPANDLKQSDTMIFYSRKFDLEFKSNSHYPIFSFSSGFPGGKKKLKVGKFERLTELEDSIPEDKELSPDNKEFDTDAGPSSYPNIKTVTAPNIFVIEAAEKSLKKQNMFTVIKKRFNRKKKIFNFYSCELCGEYCSFSSKGFRSHQVTVHKIGVLKERTWDRFGHPFEPLKSETPPASEINPNDLDVRAAPTRVGSERFCLDVRCQVTTTVKTSFQLIGSIYICCGIAGGREGGREARQQLQQHSHTTLSRRNTNNSNKRIKEYHEKRTRT
ncbi:uncharacterized protein TNCT_479611 [Trichonephila clavata]|uniref:Uncharacterized protein n=1 Tax=Trichonephila clavata TaxID=2740835 RepID=A0A8X6HJX0_TRICU|nr:uncharacterized protein TNCT_479611 [Trichonephila clavata]